MATYWTNFAKYGDPNGEGMPQWPAFSDKNPTLMYFAGTPHTGPVPNEPGLKKLDAYFAWRRSTEGASVSLVEDAKPATTNVMGAQYPRILQDRSAAFQDQSADDTIRRRGYHWQEVPDDSRRERRLERDNSSAGRGLPLLRVGC